MRPYITQGDTTVTLGDNAALSVFTSFWCSNTFSYQWLFNGTNIPGATESILTLTNVQLAQAGSYSVVASNVVNTNLPSTTSRNAVLQVLPAGAPSITVNNRLAVGTVSAIASAQVSLAGGFTNGFLFYTLDGSTPTTGSPLYSGAITLTNSATVRAMSLSADFSQTSEAPPVLVQIVPVYNLQTSVTGSGTIGANPASGPYASNSVVTLTASAAAHWAFDHWTGDATGNQNPVGVTMNGPRSVQAVFVPTEVPLTAGTPGGGSVTVSGLAIAPATYYPTGSVVSIAATASNGWTFLGWQGDASGTNNPLSVTMNQTNNIQAVFGTVVGTNSAGGGSIVLSLPNPIPYGTLLSASAVPDNGKYLVTWSGAASGTNTPTTIAVTSTNPISALFTTLPAAKYSLSVVIVGLGSVAINPRKSYYDSGDNVTLTASTTNVGSSFSGWTRDASGTNSSIVVVLGTNKIVQANFDASPTVSISPLNLVVLAGSNAVLTATASGLPPLTYQWRNSQGTIPGATNASYTIFNAQPANTGNYAVVVSNPSGSATSALASVTVVFPPAISLPPFGQVVAAGTATSLSVSATGTAPLYFQWRRTAGAIPGATNYNYLLNPAQTNDWDNYSVVVSNAYGVVTSAVATLVVYAPVTISAQPISRIVSFGDPVSFGVTASGYPSPGFQWTLNGTNVPGATSTTLVISNVGLSNLGSYVVALGNGYSSTNSATATLSMYPSITSPYVGATAVWGRSATLSVDAVGSGALTYQWYKNGVALPAGTNQTYNIPVVALSDDGLYSVVISSGLGSVTNNPAQLAVSAADITLGLYAGVTISGVVGYTYTIQYSTNLADTNSWVTATNLTLQQPVQLWVDESGPVSATPRRFYRVGAQP